MRIPESRSVFFFFFHFVISLGIFPRSNGQGVPCNTPQGEYGVCIKLDDCSILLNLVLTQSSNAQIRNFLRASRCNTEGPVKVCCPQVKPRNVDATTTTISPFVENTPSPFGNYQGALPRAPDCGYSNVTNPRIVNGIPAKLGEFSWMVALGYRNAKNPEQPKWLCGGSLITKRHILTAGHCVYNRQDLYLARLGDLDLFSDDDGASPVNILLAEAKFHEGYNPRQLTNDIAILKLQEEVNNPTVWPICLPLESSLRTKNFVNYQPTVAGWGSVAYRGPSSPTLQEVVIPVVDNAKCKTAFAGKALIDERILCAGYATGGKDSCQGDSGGPLMHKMQESLNLRYYQIGVVSYGFKCAEPGYPGVYTRVAQFMDWIERNVN